MQNARLEEAEARIKIAGININNLKYADDTIFMGESKEELKSLLMKVKEESGKRRLKTHHLKKLRSWHPISSVTQLCPALWDPMGCSTPGLPVRHPLLEFTQTHVHWVGDAIQPSHPLLSPSPPAFNLSHHQGLFRWVRWPKYWSFSFSISPSNEHSGLISFRMDWLDLLAVQVTLKSLLQHHSSKASILPCSAFFIVLLQGWKHWDLLKEVAIIFLTYTTVWPQVK